jgi:hypothetical protein
VQASDDEKSFRRFIKGSVGCILKSSKGFLNQRRFVEECPLFGKGYLLNIQSRRSITVTAGSEL